MRKSMEELVKTAKKGCEEAFDELYRDFCEDEVKRDMEADLIDDYSLDRKNIIHKPLCPKLIDKACRELREWAKNNIHNYKGKNSDYLAYLLGNAKYLRSEIYMIEAQRGNEEAKKALYLELAPFGKRTILNNLRASKFNLGPGEILLLAEDIYHEAIMELFKSIPRYIREKGKVKEYFRIITVRTISKFIKKDKRQYMDPVNKIIIEASESESVKESFDVKIAKEDLSSKMCSTILKLFVEKGGYPHQIISFFYSNIIYPTEEKPHIRGGLPGMVAEFNGSTPLHMLCPDLITRYPIGKTEDNAKAFRSLTDKMDLYPKQIIGEEKLDTATWNLLKDNGVLEVRVGDTCLFDYCNLTNIKQEEEMIKKLSKQISDWCYKVTKKVVTYLEESPKEKNDIEVLAKAYYNLKKNYEELLEDNIIPISNNAKRKGKSSWANLGEMEETEKKKE